MRRRCIRVGWMIAGAGVHESALIAVAVLIITCPCAIGLAVPAAQVVAASTLMKRGLLIKDGSALERLADADCALFDKTGTLTLGEPRPEDLSRLSEADKGVILALAGASRHPLSRGLTKALQFEGVHPAEVANIAETAGSGMTGDWRGTPVGLLRSHDEGVGLSVDFLCGGDRRRINFSDPWRADVRATLDTLRAMGIPGGILSGDRAETVAAAGREFGVPAQGAMTPAEKLAELEAMAASGRKVLMIGDGLNDGPALAGAHVSIAPGGASDVSQQAADAVFVGEALMPVALAVRVARRTMAVVRQNFAFAIVYNVLAVPLAIMGLLTPLIAAVAMSTSSLVVVGNSLRLARAAR